MFPKFYIYKITFSNGATYTGCHIERKENDSYNLERINGKN